jgi:DNA topoisomerase VI subunit B
MSSRQPAPATAVEMARRQREISVSEFFLKNRHLLGFDTPAKALVTAVKEAVDNALDASEEAGILPDIKVQVADRHGKSRVIVEDNGPGIVEGQIARIFGKLLYGSKFTSSASRAASREWGFRPQECTANLLSASRYIFAVASKVMHLLPKCSCRLIRLRTSRTVPTRPTEIKPHPYGIELGRLIQMLNNSASRTLLRFLVEEFSCVGRKTALKIIELARKQSDRKLSNRSYPRHIAHAQATALYGAIQKTRVSAPRTDCIIPIGEKQLLEGLHKEVSADFYTVTTRPAATYRGNPFQVEVAIAYGRRGDASIHVDKNGHMHKKKPEAGVADSVMADEPVRLLRFANRVPLLYQQSSCAITKAVAQTNWRGYGLHHPKGALPIAPMAILVHLASVWVPYTSESKEAIEPYPEILKEIKLGLQQCARKLAHYLHNEMHLREEYDRRAYIEKYLPHIGIALQEILVLGDKERDATVKRLDHVLDKSRAPQGAVV